MFKVYDKVFLAARIETDTENFLHYGKVYEVAEVDLGYQVIKLNGMNRWFDWDRFRLLQEWYDEGCASPR